MKSCELGGSDTQPEYLGCFSGSSRNVATTGHAVTPYMGAVRAGLREDFAKDCILNNGCIYIHVRTQLVIFGYISNL